jgi:hypothetical protein
MELVDGPGGECLVVTLARPWMKPRSERNRVFYDAVSSCSAWPDVRSWAWSGGPPPAQRRYRFGGGQRDRGINPQSRALLLQDHQRRAAGTPGESETRDTITARYEEDGTQGPAFTIAVRKRSLYRPMPGHRGASPRGGRRDAAACLGQPDGLPMKAFGAIRASLLANRSLFFKNLSTRSRTNRPKPRCRKSRGMRSGLACG